MKKQLSKKRKKRFIIAGFIVVGLIGVLFTIIVESNTPIRDQITNLGRIGLVQLDIQETTGEMFESLELAVNSYFGNNINDSRFLSREHDQIIFFEEEDYILSIFPGKIAGPFYRPNVPSIFLFLLQIRDDERYLPINQWVQGIEALFYDIRGIWYDEDRIARDLILSYIRSNITMQVNNGIPIYYGVGVGLPPEKILILGHEPDNIIHFEYENEDYFFWYYLSDHDFSNLISNRIDLSSKTLGEIIELFDIQVIR